MRLFVETTGLTDSRSSALGDRLVPVFAHVSEGTDTSGLIVVISLRAHHRGWKGACFTRDLTPERIKSLRGPLAVDSCEKLLPQLPPQFQLIRMVIGLHQLRFPRTSRDRYGWELKFRTLEDLVAFIFAHELVTDRGMKST